MLRLPQAVIARVVGIVIIAACATAMAGIIAFAILSVFARVSS